MALFASLPMYDLPEIRESTDIYWQRLTESFADHGIGEGAVPKQLTRETDPHLDWLRNDMLFSQTCGLPYVRNLRGQVTLLGSPAYDIDCAPGSYFSVIIVNRDAKGDDLTTHASGRFAFNDHRSQSGYAAYFSLLNENAITGLPVDMINSGAHLSSIAMVAKGRADIAAIDAVTFALARRHYKMTEQVKVIAQSEVTPVLPYITSLGFEDQKDIMVNAIVEAMAGLPERVRDDLMITGFNDRVDSEFDGIRAKWDMLVDLSLHQL